MLLPSLEAWAGVGLMLGLLLSITGLNGRGTIVLMTCLFLGGCVIGNIDLANLPDESLNSTSALWATFLPLYLMAGAYAGLLIGRVILKFLKKR